MYRLYIITIILCFSGYFTSSQNIKNETADYDFNLDKIYYMKVMSTFLDTTFLKRYENEIILFEKEDSATGIDKNKILFAGSSSFRKWTGLEKDMYPLQVINRGFGGSTLPELLYYYDRLILKYQPSKIVLYEGDNDITAAFLTPEIVLKCFKLFVQLTENYLPGTPIFFISVKISPSREEFMDKLLITNMLIQEYCRNHPNLYYIDITQPMYDEYGNIRRDIFQSDELHLNESGYEIWTKIIKEALLKH